MGALSFQLEGDRLERIRAAKESSTRNRKAKQNSFQFTAAELRLLHSLLSAEINGCIAEEEFWKGMNETNRRRYAKRAAVCRDLKKRLKVNEKA